MTAGLPGIGIGGVFYLLSALLMPVVEVVNTVRGRSSKERWKMVLTQFGLLSGIIGGFWGAGFILGKLIGKSSKMMAFSGYQAHLHNANVFRMRPLFISLTTLFVVLFSFQIINYFLDRKSSLGVSNKKNK